MGNDEEDRTAQGNQPLRMTADIVTSFVSNNKVAATEVPELIRLVHQALTGLSATASDSHAERPKPAVPIAKSVNEDFIVCLEDGKKLKMLKRYLRSTYNMTPDEYRRRWGLPADYPMVAPSYATRRSEFAKKIGLGRGVRRRGVD
ncbi:MAG: MucR family transcriptional regulator [Hyphomonadaceae bacterium]|nr:MucR family transcriptional regulator [Hyphomonadaceae bacterium]